MWGTTADARDVVFEFTMFLHTPVQLILYAGDEEFPSEANILFDGIIGVIMSLKDVA